jgi:membrane-bound lytic murein transglycosylase B
MNIAMHRLLVTVALLFIATTAQAADKPFDQWLEEVKVEARNRGISEPVIEAALGALAPIERVLELDKSQPEFTMSFEDYLARTVAPARVSAGRRMLLENRGLLERIAATYHVQPRFIIAFWGIESDFGRLTGGFSVPAALATLAWDGRRASLFREELFEALHIIQDGHVTAAGMTGSWAGAMGQPQFMPSSFRRFAVDGDADGKRDIWTNRADVFASIANYLSQSGWREDQTWGRRVSLPEAFDRGLISPDVKKTLQEWDALGIRRADGSALPTRALQGSLVEPTAGRGPVFMVYDNFRTTLRWNRSTFFALAVGHLADAVNSGDS